MVKNSLRVKIAMILIASVFIVIVSSQSMDQDILKQKNQVTMIVHDNELETMGRNLVVEKEQTTNRSNSTLISTKQMTAKKTDVLSKDEKDKKELPKPQPVKKRELSMIAVGDNLIHTQIVKSGLQKDGSYNFSHLFDGIRDIVEEADVAIINQETILCDKKLGYSGYPLFGSPYAIGEAVYEAGFDVILHATNHTLDKGVAGIENTIDFWKKYDDVVVAGLKEKKEDSRIVYIERNGIKLAILNYTYGLNGLRLPKGKEYMVNLLDNPKLMEKDIKLAKKKSDFVIVCPHWGTEYVYEPTTQQKEWTQFFAEQGVDLVLGTHPHVLEPVEWVKSENGENEMLVYYSLGNFVSNQDAMSRMLGGMAQIQLIEKDGEIVIDKATIEPLITHTYLDSKQQFTTYFLEDYTMKLASNHYLNRKHKNTITLSRLQSLSKEILDEWYNIAG